MVFKRYEQWNFDKKMKVFLFIVVSVTASICATLLAISFLYSITEKSKALAEQQVTTLSASLEKDLNRYRSFAWSIMMDENIKNYLNYSRVEKDNYENYDKSVNQARNTVNNLLNMQNNINFIAIIPENENNILLRCAKESMITTKFEELYQKDLDLASVASKGELQFHYSNTYSQDNIDALNLYTPIYSTEYLNDEIGLLCISLNDVTLEQITNREDKELGSKFFVITEDKKVMASTDKSPILEKEFTVKEAAGTFNTKEKLYIYQKVKAWNYYVVMSIPKNMLYKDSVRNVVMIALLMLLLVILFLYTGSKMVQKAYKPLEQVVNKMDSVTMDRLETRIKEEKMGADFKKLASGFNKMMDRIVALMTQITTEQHQMEQIKFNALQSQIQPHFLYNTLDCIHWQAVSNGDKETSVLIKALANYYRLCLSKGHDVIELSKEIEHIKNYITIQNMRYDNIIEADIKVNIEYEKIMIPKLTLQPLIENAIYHGIKVREGNKGIVQVRTKKEGETLVITVADTGNGMRNEEIEKMNSSISEHDETFGYGVRNVNKRIELLYGKEYGLQYEINEQGGVSVQIIIPLEQKILYRGILSCTKF